jgi:hypothetical protein
MLAGLLLPLPLALVLVLPRLGAPDADARARISPVLSLHQRRQLTTYLRSCQKSSECEPPLGCVNHFSNWIERPFCKDSECVTDLDCKPDHSCQVFLTEGDGPRLRICISHGLRQEGEPCDGAPSSRKYACGPGLRCWENWCGRPCHADAPQSCPEGFFCSDDVAGAVCLPTCKGRGCPEGQECVPFHEVGGQRISACVVVHGSNCKARPCPEGHECAFNYTPPHPGEVWMACDQMCGEGLPACAEGLFCLHERCRQPCDPQQPGSCGEAMKCGQFAPDEPWLCLPDL